MTDGWTQAKLEGLISNSIEESLTLDYKGPEALAKTDAKKREIAKDVSAMANSAGGTIIYGIKEYDEAEKKHLPEKIDAVDRTQYSREWLEQVINNIRPRLEGLIIYPVELDTGPHDVSYVVEVPQSNTAHQAKDYRYYKRHNFLSIPMEDYEIRDVMGRSQHPIIGLEFEIIVSTTFEDSGLSTYLRRDVSRRDKYELIVRAKNTGRIYGHYVNGFVKIPADLLAQDVIEYADIQSENGQQIVDTYVDNTIRDVVYISSAPYFTSKYGPSRYEPILPELSLRIETIELNHNLEHIQLNEYQIKWSIHADNAPAEHGAVNVSEIPVNDSRTLDE